MNIYPIYPIIGFVKVYFEGITFEVINIDTLKTFLGHSNDFMDFVAFQ